MNRVKKEIDYSKFVTGYYPLEKIQDGFDMAINHKEKAIKVMITMNDEK